MSLGMRIRTMTPQRQTRPIRKTVRSRCSRAKSMILSIMDNSPLAGDHGVGKRGVSMDRGSLEAFVMGRGKARRVTGGGGAEGGEHAGLQTIPFVLDLGPDGDGPRLLLQDVADILDPSFYPQVRVGGDGE